MVAVVAELVTRCASSVSLLSPKRRCELGKSGGVWLELNEFLEETILPGERDSRATEGQREGQRDSISGQVNCQSATPLCCRTLISTDN